MAKATVWFVVDYAIAPEGLAEFERVAAIMSDESAKEPGTLLYSWCIGADTTQCRLIESYVDGAAVLAHITGPVITTWVPEISKVSKVTLFEVYGDPGPEATATLEQIGAKVYTPRVGFSR